MLIGLLTTFLVLDGLLLVLFVLIQKGKGSMGLGALGGGAQTLFGGSGGQDIFQKITWILGGIFMAGSLGLAILKSTGTSFNLMMPSRSAIPSSTFSNRRAGGIPPKNQQEKATQPTSAPLPESETKK